MGATVQDIVQAFLQTYYQRMSKDPSKVSCLYSITAELTHINYQVGFNFDGDALPTIKLTGKENISKFFTRNNKKVSDLKVKIDSCDFQTTGSSHGSILILTTGEMFWTGTAAYRFCQTIILAPNANNKDAFDVTNDVIRFIPDSFTAFAIPAYESYEKEDEAKLDVKPSDEFPVTNETSHEQDLEIKNEKEKDVESENAQIRQELKTNSSDLKISKAIDPQSEISHASAEEEDASAALEELSSKGDFDEKADENVAGGSNIDEGKGDGKSKVKDVDPETIVVVPAPPVRMSWASKLAANGDSSKITSAPWNNEGNKTDIQYNGNKKTNEMKSELSTRKENNSNRATKKKLMFSTVNKDGFYPIYIRGTAGLKEENLRSVLEMEFGTIMKITNADSFAVVDFETQKSQIDALEKKQLTIGETEVFLGRKTVKKSSSSPPAGSSSSVRSHKKHTSKKRD